MSIFAFYLIAAILGIVGGVGIINSGINKVTSGVHLFGMLGIIIYLLPRHAGWHILGVIIVSVIFSFISFSVFYRFRR